MRTAALALLAVLLHPVLLIAAVPDTIHYQGRLTDPQGRPIDGPVAVVVRIYDHDSAGSLLYEETVGTVEVDAGKYAFSFGAAGNTIEQQVETVTTTNGVNQIFLSTLAGDPIPGTLSISDGVFTWTQAGGSSDPTRFVVNHVPATASVQVSYLAGIPPAGRLVQATYGAVVPAELFAVIRSPELYLGLSIDGEELRPRTRLLAVPFAMMARSSADARQLAERVNAEVATREAGLAAEAAARAAGDTALQTSLGEEVSARAAGDSALGESIASETTARIAADDSLTTALGQESAARLEGDASLTTALGNESAARASADDALTSSLGAESAARQAGDTALQTSLGEESIARTAGDAALGSSLAAETASRTAADDDITTALGQESTARAAGDTTLQANLATEVAAREAALASEAASRAAGDTALQTSLGEEATARAAGDSALGESIASETTARIAAVDSLTTALGQESAARLEGDASLTTALGNESAARTAADEALTSSLGVESAARQAGDTALQTSLGEEAIARTGGDAALGSSLASETVARTAADDDITTALGQESAARAAGDTTLQGNLDTEVAAREVALASEAASRAAADTALQMLLGEEATARAASDSALGESLAAEAAARTAADDDITTALGQESAARATGDTTLQGNLNTEIAAREAALVAEASSRAAADTALQTSLGEEATARAAGDSALGESIASETTARIAAVDSLTTALGQESAARLEGDASLTTALGNESAARTAADEALTSSLGVESAARQAGDTALQTSLGEEAIARTAGDAALGSSLASETVARTAADDDMTTALGQESAARAAGDTTLQGNLDTEVAAREAALVAEAASRAAADTALQTSLGEEASARAAGDSALGESIASETTARIAAVDSLATALGQESAARLEGDASLTAALGNESAARTSADDALTASLGVESAARQAGDTALQTSLGEEATARVEGDALLEEMIANEVQDLGMAMATLTMELDAERQQREQAIRRLEQGLPLFGEISLEGIAPFEFAEVIRVEHQFEVPMTRPPWISSSLLSKSSERPGWEGRVALSEVTTTGFVASVHGAASPRVFQSEGVEWATGISLGDTLAAWMRVAMLDEERVLVYANSWATGARLFLLDLGGSGSSISEISVPFNLWYGCGELLVEGGRVFLAGRVANSVESVVSEIRFENGEIRFVEVGRLPVACLGVDSGDGCVFFSYTARVAAGVDVLKVAKLDLETKAVEHSPDILQVSVAALEWGRSSIAFVGDSVWVLAPSDMIGTEDVMVRLARAQVATFQSWIKSPEFVLSEVTWLISSKIVASGSSVSVWIELQSWQEAIVREYHVDASLMEFAIGSHFQNRWRSDLNQMRGDGMPSAVKHFMHDNTEYIHVFGEGFYSREINGLGDWDLILSDTRIESNLASAPYLGGMFEYKGRLASVFVDMYNARARFVTLCAADAGAASILWSAVTLQP